MTVLHEMAGLRNLKGPVALAIGVFDGVHLGHREVIGEALDFAAHHHGTAVVMTFDPHPMRVLRPGQAPRLLCSTPHKLLILERMGVSHVLVYPFTDATARTEASAFIGALAEHCQPLGFVSVGCTWSFGKGRSGDIHKLMELGKAHDFAVCGVPEVKMDGKVVSSTVIREAVRTGEFATAKALLGTDYSVFGEVIKGQQLASQWGFPTANVAMQNEEIPPNGVYAVEIVIAGERHKGVANLGLRPTFGLNEKSLEVHLLDFSRDLYGQYVEVIFIQKLRDEQKFDGLDALRAQIAKDVAHARQAFGLKK